MKNPLSSFFATRASETQPGAEPALVPMGVPAAPRAQQQINQALAQICQHIAAQEVQDLLDTGEYEAVYNLIDPPAGVR